MADPKPIDWQDRPYGGRYGLVGGVRIFTASWSLDRADHEAGRNYVLRCDLPGYARKTWALSRADAEAAASRILTEWLSRVLA